MSDLSFMYIALTDVAEGEPWQQLGEKKRHTEIKLKVIIVLTDFFPQTWFLVFNKEEKLSIQLQHDTASTASKHVLRGLGSGETCCLCHYGRLMFGGLEIVSVSFIYALWWKMDQEWSHVKIYGFQIPSYLTWVLFSHILGVLWVSDTGSYD